MEALAVAIATLSHQLLGQWLSWEHFFAHERPRHVAQYWVNLGQKLRFGQPLNLMRVPRLWSSENNAGRLGSNSHFHFCACSINDTDPN